MADVPNVSAVHRLLDSNTVAELRALNEGNMAHVCTITTLPTTGTRVGGALADKTPIVLFTDLRCRLTPRRLRALEQLQAGQEQAHAQWTLVVPAGTTIPSGAVAVVSHLSDDCGCDTPTRTVRISAPANSRTFEIGARYNAEDVSPAGR